MAASRPSPAMISLMIHSCHWPSRDGPLFVTKHAPNPHGGTKRPPSVSRLNVDRRMLRTLRLWRGALLPASSFPALNIYLMSFPPTRGSTCSEPFFPRNHAAPADFDGLLITWPSAMPIFPRIFVCAGHGVPGLTRHECRELRVRLQHVSHLTVPPLLPARLNWRSHLTVSVA